MPSSNSYAKTDPFNQKVEANRQAVAQTAAAAAAQVARNNEAAIAAQENQLRKYRDDRPAYQSLIDQQEAVWLKKQAYGTDPLQQYQALREQAKLAGSQGRDRLGMQLTDELQNQSVANAGQQTNAYSQLAMGGGLSSGARERIAAGGAESNMYALQNARLGNQKALNENENLQTNALADLGVKEAQAREGLQNTYLQLKQQDLTGRNAYLQEGYNKKIDTEAGFLNSRNQGKILGG